MTDSTDQNNPNSITSPIWGATIGTNSTPVDSAEWMPKAPGNASANAQSTDTKSLNSLDSINTENPNDTGFAASSQGPTAISGSPSASVPASINPSATPTATNTNLGSSSTGNTQTASNATGNTLANNITPQVPGVPGQTAGSQTGQVGGLSNSVFTQAIGTGAKNLFGDAIDAVNQFGNSTLGLGTGSGTGQALDNSLTDVLNEGDAGIDSELSGAAASEAPATGATIGSSAEGALGTTTSLTSALGSAGIGAFEGNLISSFVGGNQVGGSIGGAIGGAAGGLAAGTEAGAELGSFAGPIGTVLGAAAGALIGGLFGNSSPGTQADTYSATLNPDGTTNYRDSGAKNAGSYAGFGQALTTQLSTVFQSASSALGIKFNPDTAVGGGISTLHGGSYVDVVDQPQTFFDYTNPQATSNAFYTVLNQAAAESGYTDTSALYNWYYGVDSTTSNPAASAQAINISPKAS